jgi:cell wall-associated NlpC family hydrolase
MSNSLPDVGRKRRCVERSGLSSLKAACATALALVLTLSAVASPVVAGDSVSVEMPKAKERPQGFKPSPRTSDPIAALAARALTPLMRTDGETSGAYSVMRTMVADAIEKRTGVSAVKLEGAWSKTTRRHQVALMTALTQLGVKYRHGSESPGNAIDCSGLLWYAWRAAGIKMPRYSKSQLDRRNQIEQEEAKAGDIVGRRVHVRMYLGTDLLTLEAPYGGEKVRLRVMSTNLLPTMSWADPTKLEEWRVWDWEAMAEQKAREKAADVSE